MGMQLAYVGMFSLWEDCFGPYLSQTNPSVYVLSSVVILEYFFFLKLDIALAVCVRGSLYLSVQG